MTSNIIYGPVDILPKPVTLPDSALKPRIRILKDEYAKLTGEVWWCRNAIYGTRGHSMQEAYDKFNRAAKWIHKHQTRAPHGPVRF